MAYHCLSYFSSARAFDYPQKQDIILTVRFYLFRGAGICDVRTSDELSPKIDHKTKTTSLILAAIVLLALILRVYGLNYGLPYMYKADAKAVLQPAANMVSTGDLNPHFFRYPSFCIYFQAIARVLAKGVTNIWEATFHPACRQSRYIPS